MKHAIIIVATLLHVPLAVVSAVAAPVDTEAERPNIIFVMADDLGWGDVGFNGNTVIKTPQLDAMAKDGMRLTRFKPEERLPRGFYSPPWQHGFDESFATTGAVPTWNPSLTPAGEIRDEDGDAGAPAQEGAPMARSRRWTSKSAGSRRNCVSSASPATRLSSLPATMALPMQRRRKA